MLKAWVETSASKGHTQQLAMQLAGSKSAHNSVRYEPTPEPVPPKFRVHDISGQGSSGGLPIEESDKRQPRSLKRSTLAFSAYSHHRQGLILTAAAPFEKSYRLFCRPPANEWSTIMELTLSPSSARLRSRCSMLSRFEGP